MPYLDAAAHTTFFAVQNALLAAQMLGDVASSERSDHDLAHWPIQLAH
jgi:hypothetical protein